MPDPQLREAFHLIQSGKNEKAQAILDTVLADDPINANALYLASFLAESPAERASLLRRALAQNPDHTYARQALAAIERDPISASMLIPDDDSFLDPPKPKRAIDPALIGGFIGGIVLTGIVAFAIGRGWLFPPPQRSERVTALPTEPPTESPSVITVMAIQPTPTRPFIIITATATDSPIATPASRDELIDDDPFIGPIDAPVVMVEFGDYEDPFTARFNETTLPALFDRYGNQLLYVFRDFPLEAIHPNSFAAAEAANCVRKQDAFWDFHNTLLDSQGEAGVGAEAINALVDSMFFDSAFFDTCWQNHDYEFEVQQDMSDGVIWGVTGTPTFFINGTRIIGAVPLEEFILAIDRELED